MDEYKDIKFILGDYYPNIAEFLGDIIEQRLRIRNPENGVLTSQLLNAAHKEASYNEDEYIESSDLDPDLYRLEQTLGYGDEYCEDFNLIFQNVTFSQSKDMDAKILDILAQVKAFEWLSKLGFRDITKILEEDKPSPAFIARRGRETYAISVARLTSAQYVEERSKEYELREVQDRLKSDIANIISQRYLQIKEYCEKRIGLCKAIIFVSSGRDYFGDKKFENKLYGLNPSKTTIVLNQEWRMLKEKPGNHKYLHHIVITVGKNVLRSIIYPNLK